MSGNDLDHSTDTLDGFFDDVSPTSFITQWGQSQSRIEKAHEIENSTSSVRVGWLRRYRGGSLYHGLEFPTQVTAAQEADWRSILDRCICHLVVDLVPDRGLADIKEHLFQALEFYSHESAPGLPPVSQRRNVQVLHRYDREIPVLDEG